MAGINRPVLSVSRLNAYVRSLLEDNIALSSFRLEGEVSGFKAVASGHWYFTLKDDMAAVSCVMYRSSAARCSLFPQNGMRVEISGKVSLYEKTGAYQVIATSMRPAGIGSIYQALERLKEKLAAEGLFSDERKRPLPHHPRKIAAVTSSTGAVIHDIFRVAALRDPSIPIVLVPTLVQGEEAAEQIAAALDTAGKIPGVDVVILARGGGSMEDLWCFNEEQVVRAICACPVPVISAVGHESDVTLADLAADRRASTPSNAAEIAVPDRAALKKQLSALMQRLNHCLDRIVTGKKLAVMNLSSRLESQSPQTVLMTERQRLKSNTLRLENAAKAILAQKQMTEQQIAERLCKAGKQAIALKRTGFDRLVNSLHLLNPGNVLERGYAMVYAGEQVISTADAASRQKELTLQFADGTVKAVPKEEKNHE